MITLINNRLVKIFVFFYLSALSPSCSHTQFQKKKKENSKEEYWKKEKSINFLILGDWGRNGEFHQKDVANAMALNGIKDKSNFIISTGDNFYPDGVISVDDPQWSKSFEDIYSGASLNIPWFTVFGNHDYRGSIEAQLDYSKKSRRWRTTERYYSFEKTIPNSNEKVIFIFLDTNPFDETLNKKYHSDLSKQDTAAQLKWLENTLTSSNAKWKIIIGHHPLFTTGVRRDKLLNIRNTFLPFFNKHEIDIYFAGHEHDLQYQKPEGKTHYFISGAGSEIRPVSKDLLQTKFAMSTNGFISACITKDFISITFINHKGKQLYQTSIIK